MKALRSRHHALMARDKAVAKIAAMRSRPAATASGIENALGCRPLRLSVRRPHDRASATTPPLASMRPMRRTMPADRRRLLAGARLAPERERRIDARARDLIEAIRARSGGLGGVEEMLREYALSTKEGLALMVLAEALLRVPDAATADRLIEDKLGQGDFAHHEPSRTPSSSTPPPGRSASRRASSSRARRRKASSASSPSASACRPCARRPGRPCASWATISCSARPSRRRSTGRASGAGRLYRYSFDMLGEGARTAEDAEPLFRLLRRRHRGDRPRGRQRAAAEPARHLGQALGAASALRGGEPRARVCASSCRASSSSPARPEVLRPQLHHRCRGGGPARALARRDRARRSPIRRSPGWDGFGLAIQAYQKRAGAVIDCIAALAERLDRRLMVRLVKGAYWDTEVKRAQERGLDDYPVFTRKAMTDLQLHRLRRAAPARCGRASSRNSPPTTRSPSPRSSSARGRRGGYEFQRLHGMGEALYGRLIEDRPGRRLPHLRAGRRPPRPPRLSRAPPARERRQFVLRVGRGRSRRAGRDPAASVRPTSSARPRRRGIRGCRCRATSTAPGAATRAASSSAIERRSTALARRGAPRRAAGAVAAALDRRQGGHRRTRAARPEPDRRRDGRRPGRRSRRRDGGRGDARPPAPAFAPGARPRRAPRRGARARRRPPRDAARAASSTSCRSRAARPSTTRVSELREAVDFCRYYAAQGATPLRRRREPARPDRARSNVLRLRGRGVFVAISPWNFPLAIFLGQVAAALMAGNASSRSRPSRRRSSPPQAVRLLHEAGVPPCALHLVPGDGRVGARLVEHPRRRRRRLHRLDRGRAADQPRACREGRADRAADRRDRRHQRHDRRRDRASRAGRRRRRHLGLPLRRPALLGAAAALRAGGRRRPHDRDDRRRRARAEARRSARRRDPYRPGDRRARRRTGSTRISRA